MNTTTIQQIGNGSPLIKCNYCEEIFESFEVKSKHEMASHPKEDKAYKESITKLFGDTIDFHLKSDGTHLYNILPLHEEYSK